jgi:hypothetical protein
MKKKLSKAYWIPDMDTFNQLQKLKKFVDFVAGLAYSTAEQKDKAEQIKLLIENIDKPETFQEWSVCIDIFDTDVQAGIGTGVYWRGWRIDFESGRLEVEAFFHFLDDNHLDDDDSIFYGCYFFEKDATNEFRNIEVNMDGFIADAMNYEHYITPSLNEIEVEIDIWSKNKKTPEPNRAYRVNINLDIDKIVGKYLKKE